MVMAMVMMRMPRRIGSLVVVGSSSRAFMSAPWVAACPTRLPPVLRPPGLTLWPDRRITVSGVHQWCTSTPGAVSLPIGPPVSGVVRVVAAGGEAQSGDGVVVDGQDLQLPVVHLDGVARVGQAPQAVQDQAGHGRVRPLGQGDAEIR